MSGFRNFILRGNLVDLAVAVIIGTSFGAVVTAFTKLLLSIIAKITGGDTANFDNYYPGDIAIGPFLTAVIAFLILAAVVYFFVVSPYVVAKEKFFPSPEPGTPEDVKLLQEIRDLLAAQGSGPGAVPGAGPTI